ncbi:uncharacterized protein LOC121389706 [Gigantopelta aegis]|uniref:uncharacterized protein LOC121389706 n=1 Tax=Gigantopelta aegis TaxID=1735272 RepID=UPI001B889A46|nr:uncharacterized protein LOC121389706 [Gigantopelta aegis]
MGKTNLSTLDGTLKRVHTEVSDFLSSDEESMKSKTNVKKSKVISSQHWPRFLVISSTDDGALNKLSPFAIQKAIVGLAGEPKSVKKIKNGLLVECLTEKHSTCLLKSTVFCNVPIKVTPHTSLNSSKGVNRCRDLAGVSEEEICQNLSPQGVTAVRRIKVRRNNDLLPTNTCILTFNVPTLPQSVKAGYLNIPVEPFIPNPLRCFKCQRFGHGQNTCSGKLTCALLDHDSKTCKNDVLCLNCKGNHCAYSRECPRWKLEKRVQQVKVQNKITFMDARRLVETATPTVATKSVAVNTDLTWHCDEAKYKKLSDIEKAQKQVQKKAQKEKSLSNTRKLKPKCHWILRIPQIGRALVSLRQAVTQRNLQRKLQKYCLVG